MFDPFERRTPWDIFIRSLRHFKKRESLTSHVINMKFISDPNRVGAFLVHVHVLK